MEITKLVLNENDLDAIVDALLHRHPNEHVMLRLALMQMRDALVIDKVAFPGVNFGIELRSVVRADEKEQAR